MKIAHLISQFYPYLGGAEICVHNICTTLVRNGHQAEVITTVPATDPAPEVNYEIRHLSSKTNGLFRRCPFLAAQYLNYSLGQIQKRCNFDLWQVTMGYPLGAYAVDFFRKKQLPCLLRCCGEDIQKMPEISYGYRLDPKIDAVIEKKYPEFDGLIALTPSVREEYLSLGISPEKIKIIPNGVDTRKFLSIAKRPLFQERFGVPPETRVILTVGRHHPKKGYDRIPVIAAELKKRGINFLWIIVGRDHEEFDRRFPEAAELGIHTLENKPDPNESAFSLPSESLIEMYRSADIFAFPTLLETFGMVLIEAMAAGLPIVTTDAAGVRDVIKHEKNGLRTAVEDVSLFTDYLASLLENPELYAEYQQKSLKSAEFYDWTRITGEYLEFYQSFL